MRRGGDVERSCECVLVVAVVGCNMAWLCNLLQCTGRCRQGYCSTSALMCPGACGCDSCAHRGEALLRWPHLMELKRNCCQVLELGSDS